MEELPSESFQSPDGSWRDSSPSCCRPVVRSSVLFVQLTVTVTKTEKLDKLTMREVFVAEQSLLCGHTQTTNGVKLAIELLKTDGFNKNSSS